MRAGGHEARRAASARAPSARALLVCALLVAWSLAAAAGADEALAAGGGLPDHLRETELLVDAPGTSASVAAGLFNPAAWPVQGEGGLFLGLTDPDGGAVPTSWAAALSFGHLGFGIRRFGLRQAAGGPPGAAGDRLHVLDYTLGVGVGGRAGAFGLSYGWGGGDLDRAPRHERLTLGGIWRRRPASLGLSGILDLDAAEERLQGDLGLRPFGPRLTLSADAFYDPDQPLEDLEFAFGAEIQVLSSLTVAGRLRDDGDFALRVGVGLAPGLWGGVRPALDDDGDHRQTTWTIELRRSAPSLLRELTAHRQRVAELHLKGIMGYRRYRFLDRRRTLLSTLQTIRRAAEDPGVGALLVNLSGARLGAEMTWEIRQQLAGFRRSGKSVVVYLDRASLFGYMLATVADQIWMDPQGSLSMPGLSAGRTFYRRALDRLGLGVDEWRFFTYKSAFEVLSRNEMSVPDRDQRQKLLDDFYETVSAAITSARGLTRRQWDDFVDAGGQALPAEAMAASLVDSIGGFEEARRAARRLPRRSTQDAGAPRLDGLMGRRIWSRREWGRPPRIALFYAVGACEMDTGIKGRLLSRRIREAAGDPGIKAIVLRVESPGGDPLPSDLVARALAEASQRKPVIVSQGGVAASGGYWISMYGDKVVASPLTLTGSIGIIGGWIYNDGFGDKLGLDYDGVKKGAHADVFRGITLPFLGQTLPDRALTPEERTRVEELMRDLYQQFVSKVAAGRGMAEAAVDAIAQGRVWSGVSGEDVGLVDELGGLWHSLLLAKQAAGIPAERGVEVVEGPPLGLIDLHRLRPRLLGWAGLVGPAVPADLAEAGLAEPASSAQQLLSAEEELFLEAILKAQGRPLLLMEPLRLEDGGPRP